MICLNPSLIVTQAVYTLEGCETAAQLAEETARAAWLSPLAIVTSIVGSYLIGLAYLLSLLFCLQSTTRIQQTQFAIPIAQLFFDALDGQTHKGSNLTKLSLVVVALAQFMAAVTAFTASSRLLYALSRDNAILPWWGMKRRFMQVNRFQAPYWGVWTSVGIGCAVSCAYIGSAIAVSSTFLRGSALLSFILV